MRRWLICGVLLIGVASCSTTARWRQQRLLGQMDRVFAACAEKRLAEQLSEWTAEIRCGNAGARQILAESNLRYKELIEVALAYRLEVAQQIDAGAISTEEGQARLAALDVQIHALPGSLLDLLSITAAVNPR
jgi:hypothetical protein